MADSDDEPLCAAPGGDNNAVGIEFLKPGTTATVFAVFNCAVVIVLACCLALCFTDLPWYHTFMVSPLASNHSGARACVVCACDFGSPSFPFAGYLSHTGDVGGGALV